MQLDLMPHLDGLLAGLKLLLESCMAFQHPLVIKLDALALGALLAMPVASLKALFGTRRLALKQLIVPMKTIEHGLRDLWSHAGIESGRAHRSFRVALQRMRG